MLTSLLLKALDPITDSMIKKLFTEDYADNPYIAITAAQKLTARAIIEAAIRSETGKVLTLPYGSPINLSPWEKILLNPRQLFELPTESIKDIDMSVTIGKNAKKPLKLDIPMMITGMSYGGSLSLRMKMALAKGAAMVGTSTNTGESAVSEEVRSNTKYLIGQYNRGGLMTTPEKLSKLDAIEVQLGQGAWGGAVESTKYADTIDEHLREVWDLQKGEDSTIYSRMPNTSSTEDIIELINNLKSQYDVPIGVKIAGTDFIEDELKVISKTKADYIVIDGSEGGTAVAPPTLADNVGLPTLHTLSRTIKWLEEKGIRDKFDIIVAGGLSTPGHFLKAKALGADAVYIGSIAVFATVQCQAVKTLPEAPPTQLALHEGKYADKLDIDVAANNLANFLTSCTEEMKMALQAVGKKSIKDLNKEDLVTVDKELAEFLKIRYAASPRS
ncbi:archaeal-type glutamate synthase GltB [Gottschalkia purinilytica]|uniref:Archaeal-type glutamate synthase GltB n=1 Tax=Gottschalkia purinilytica TaxID=1503 RepID=A0A0L0W9C6_GOTPU|nr:FMN-binding glutamate synthase family protein [Gottschalkia purinilytica]KNF08158.1 archaeal-type glutamate synthase GltB [Gottschalkia purinilytica]